MSRALVLVYLMMLALCCQAAELWSVKLNAVNSVIKSNLSITSKGTLDLNLLTAKDSKFTLSTAPAGGDNKPICALVWSKAW